MGELLRLYIDAHVLFRAITRSQTPGEFVAVMRATLSLAWPNPM
jgi:hypothetical protein